jgi:ABC-type transporter Mla subunit MlaD
MEEILEALDPDRAEHRAFRWIIEELGEIKQQIADNRENEMADLSGLTAALNQIGTDIAAEATDTEAALAALQATIATLTAGQISQATIDTLTAQATAADAAVQAVDAAAKAANPPAVVTPPAFVQGTNADGTPMVDASGNPVDQNGNPKPAA